MGLFDYVKGVMNTGSLYLPLLAGDQGDKDQAIRDQAYAQSKEFAQSGVQWRVEDAKRAGISPLAALGMPLASGPSYSIGGNSATDPLESMGQSIGRAMDAVSTAEGRKKATIVEGLQLERASLENELLRSQISSVNRANNPPLPSMVSNPTNPATAGTRSVPVEVSVSEKNPAKAAGYHPDMTYVNTSNGGLAIVPSKDAKQLIEDQFVPETMWAARNHLATFIKDPPYPSIAPPAGYKWKWHPWIQEWRPYRPSGSSGSKGFKRFWNGRSSGNIS